MLFYFELLVQIVRQHLARINANIRYAIAQRNNHATSEAAALFIGGNWLLKVTGLNEAEFEKYATWNQESYTRNCIARTDTYELILLCWEKKQETPIHEHGG